MTPSQTNWIKRRTNNEFRKKQNDSSWKQLQKIGLYCRRYNAFGLSDAEVYGISATVDFNMLNPTEKDALLA